jgi:hypothetical protein
MSASDFNPSDDVDELKPSEPDFAMMSTGGDELHVDLDVVLEICLAEFEEEMNRFV